MGTSPQMRGSAIVEVLVAAVILMLAAGAALATTSGGVGLIARGRTQSREATVLLRVLELGRTWQTVPGTIEGFTVTTASRALVNGTDVSLTRAVANSTCQGPAGNCAAPMSAVTSLNRVDVTVSGSGETALTIRGAVFTRP